MLTEVRRGPKFVALLVADDADHEPVRGAFEELLDRQERLVTTS